MSDMTHNEKVACWLIFLFCLLVVVAQVMKGCIDKAVL